MADIRRESLLLHAQLEADRHKWIESERHRRDLGERALREWGQKHWPKFVRACWNEHLEGKRFWAELDRNDFGILRRLSDVHPELVAKIHRKLRAGQENLDVILWALQYELDLNLIQLLLEDMDINRCRAIKPPFKH